MSQIWRKIREGKDGSKESKRTFRLSHTSGSQQLQQKQEALNNNLSGDGRYVKPLSADQHGKKLILPGIENFFFPALSAEVSDPLLAIPQYVTTLQQVLANPKTRRYFLRYLEGSEKQALAAFWLDVTSLRRSCAQGRPREAAAAVDVHCGDKGRDHLEAATVDVHSGCIGREHLEVASDVTAPGSSRTGYHEAGNDNYNQRINHSVSDAQSNDGYSLPNRSIPDNRHARRSKQQLPDLVNNISIHGSAVSGKNSNLNSPSNDKCFCDTGSKTCDHCVAAIRLGNRAVEDCLNDNSLVCDTQPNWIPNANAQFDGGNNADSVSSVLSTVKENNYCNSGTNFHDSITEANSNEDDEFGEFFSSVTGSTAPSALADSTVDHQNNSKCASTELDINKRNLHSSDQLNCSENTTSSNKSYPNLNIQSTKPLNSHLGNKTEGDLNSSPTLGSSQEVASHGCSEVTLQHHVKEVWRIFERYIAVDSHFCCPLSESAKRRIVETVGRIHVQFDLDCFTEAQEEALSALQSEVPGFVSSELHLLHQLDLLSYSTTTLPDVLHSHIAFPYFMEHMEQEGGRPLLEFWMAATNFRNQLKEVAVVSSQAKDTFPLLSAASSTNNNTTLSCPSSRASSQSPKRVSPNRTVNSSQSSSSPRPCSSSPSSTTKPSPKQSSKTAPPPNRDRSLSEPQSQVDAMVVYDKYFSLQAPQQLGFSDGLRCSIESNICRETGPEHTCFDVPLRVVLYVLDTIYMPGYLRSALYQSYVADLMAAVRTMSSGGRQRTNSGSTCSSDLSGAAAGVATSNTLLAVDTSTLGGGSGRGVRGGSRLPSAGLPATASSLRIDNSPIRDPDSLWRRHNSGHLSCGAVTSLGRFEPQLLPPPDSIPGAEAANRLTRALRRLANRDQDKARLEHAYAVAELVVRDVTRVTLDTNNSPLNHYHPSNPYDIALSAHFRNSFSYPSTTTSSHPLLPSSVPLSASTESCSFPCEPSSASSSYVAMADFGPQHSAAGGWTAHSSVRGSNTNLSTVSTNSSSNSDLRQIPGTIPASVYSPTKSVKSTLSKSSSNYNFSDLTDSLFSGFGNTNGLAHSYSLASFDLGTDIDDLDFARNNLDFPAVALATATTSAGTSTTNVQH